MARGYYTPLDTTCVYQCTVMLNYTYVEPYQNIKANSYNIILYRHTFNQWIPVDIAMAVVYMFASRYGS